MTILQTILISIINSMSTNLCLHVRLINMDVTNKLINISKYRLLLFYPYSNQKIIIIIHSSHCNELSTNLYTEFTRC